MRVAIDGTVVRPPWSGVQHAVRQQMLALLAARGDTQWCCYTRDTELRAVAQAAGQLAPALPALLTRVAARVAWQQARLPCLLRGQGCDALLALAYTAPLRAPVPYALQVHDLIALTQPALCRTLNAWHMRTLMPASIRGARWVLATSTPGAEQLRQLFPAVRARVHVLPLGVDPLFLTATAALPYPAALDAAEPARAPYLLFVGVLEPKKGLATLLAAYRELAARQPLTLVLAGRVGWKCVAELQALDAYRGPGRVLRLGYVPREELPALYQHAAAYVQPSCAEGFGLPVLEAMVMGTPVVHSDLAELEATAGGNGLSFAVGDAAALARQLQRVLASPDLRAELAARGQAWARTRTYTRWAADLRALTGWA